MSETVVLQPVNPLEAASQKVQEAFQPFFELMHHKDFKHIMVFSTANVMPEVEFTKDGCGIVISHLPNDLTRERLEASPIIDICHQIKHLYNDGDRIGKTGIKEKKERGHELENSKLRACITYTYLVTPTKTGNQLTIRFYLDQSKDNRARVKESFKRDDVTDVTLRELKKSKLLVCHNRDKVIAWRYLSREEQEDLLKVVLVTCSEEIKQFVHDAYFYAYWHETVPNYLVTTPPLQ